MIKVGGLNHGLPKDWETEDTTNTVRAEKVSGTVFLILGVP